MGQKNRINRSFFASFSDALTGLWDCIKLERNMRIHLSVMIYALVLCMVLKVERRAFGTVFLAMSGVIATEMLNTALEKLCDFTQAQYCEQIRLIKDISAGAVLVTAVFAVAVGVSVFWQAALWQLFLKVVTTPRYLLLFLLSLGLTLVFVRWRPGLFREKGEREEPPGKG